MISATRPRTAPSLPGSRELTALLDLVSDPQKYSGKVNELEALRSEIDAKLARLNAAESLAEWEERLVRRERELASREGQYSDRVKRLKAILESDHG